MDGPFHAVEQSRRSGRESLPGDGAIRNWFVAEQIPKELLQRRIAGRGFVVECSLVRIQGVEQMAQALIFNAAGKRPAAQYPAIEAHLPAVRRSNQHRDFSQSAELVFVRCGKQECCGIGEVPLPLLLAETLAVKIELIRLIDQLKCPHVIPGLNKIECDAGFGSLQELIGNASGRLVRIPPGRGIPNAVQPERVVSGKNRFPEDAAKVTCQ